MARKKSAKAGYAGKWNSTGFSTTREQARAAGARFQAAAIAEGFTGLRLMVHENLGWHFNVWSEGVAFYPGNGGRISILAGGGIPRAGRVAWSTDDVEFTTFTDAWRAVLKKADAEIADLQRRRALVDRALHPLSMMCSR